jgi:hypothetical protein
MHELLPYLRFWWFQIYHFQQNDSHKATDALGVGGCMGQHLALDGNFLREGLAINKVKVTSSDVVLCRMIFIAFRTSLLRCLN